MRIDRHRPFNRPGCRVIALICLYQRGRAGGSAAVPAANIFFGFGCLIILIVILERKPCDITAQVCGTVVHLLRHMALIGDCDRLVICCNWGNGKVIIRSGCCCYRRSIYLYGAVHQCTAIGEPVMECQIVTILKSKAIRLECDRPISRGAITGITGRVSLLCHPCGLRNGNGATAGDIQTIEHVIFTGKQVGGVCYFLTACASWQEKIIVDRGLIGNRQRRCRVPLGCFSCVEFCAAKGQNSVAAVLWRFHNHICVLIALDFIAGSIGRHGRSADCHAVGYIAVQRGINGVPQLKGGVQVNTIVPGRVLPRGIVDCPGNCLILQLAVFVNLCFCRHRLIFRIAESDLLVIFKFHRIEVAVPLYGTFSRRNLICPVAIQIEKSVVEFTIL